jgi:hypothetical protein
MPKKPKARILRGRITHISLVDRGANQIETLYKAEDDGSFEIHTLMAKSSEEGLLTALVYLPEQVDAHGHIASMEVIKSLCHDYFSEGGGQIDVMHDLEDIQGGAHIAESFMVQKGDPRFAGIKDYDGNVVDPTGSWGVIIKLQDERLRALYREGRFNGVSMFGKGVLAPTEQVTKQFQNALADRLGSPSQGDDSMNEEQMTKLLEKFFQPINKRLEKLEKLEKPEPKPEPEPVQKSEPEIKFEGDPTSAEDLAKHKDKVFQASCDLNTLEGIEKWEKYQAAKAEPKEVKKVEEVEESEEIKKALADKAGLEKKIADLRKASSQKGDEVQTTLSKEEQLQKGFDLGKSIGQNWNKSLGRE